MLPPKENQRVKHPQALLLKRKQQCQAIKQKVSASQKESQKVERLKRERHSTPGAPISPLEDAFVREISNEEDPCAYFSMSLVQRLRNLPDAITRHLMIKILDIINVAEEQAEKTSTSPYLDKESLPDHQEELLPDQGKEPLPDDEKESLPDLPLPSPEMEVCSTDYSFAFLC